VIQKPDGITDDQFAVVVHIRGLSADHARRRGEQELKDSNGISEVKLAASIRIATHKEGLGRAIAKLIGADVNPITTWPPLPVEITRRCLIFESYVDSGGVFSEVVVRLLYDVMYEREYTATTANQCHWGVKVKSSFVNESGVGIR